MTRYLLVAEADKIQSTIFRATRLKEIVGGSQALTAWCRETAGQLRMAGIPERDIIVADGGALRVLFDDEDICRRWSEELSASYARCVGGTMTVTEPIPVEGDFRRASSQGQAALRRAKSRPFPATAALHSPYAAICQVCGVGLAGRKTVSPEGETVWVCPHCAERRSLYREGQRDSADSFLGAFFGAVESHLPFHVYLTAPQSINELGKADERSYVAYLAADANDMGVLFSRCEQEQMRRLSQELPNIVRTSLAKATALLLANTAERQSGELMTPVLPLIMGGDDLLAITTTPYCLDLARHFAGAYGQAMLELVRELGLEPYRPRISIGLVIVKAIYPHTLAYELAHERLSQAKLAARGREAGVGLISFAFAGSDTVTDSDFQPGLGVYQLDEEIPSEFVPLTTLMAARQRLDLVPKSRLADIHLLYDPLALPSRQGREDERKDEWLKEMRFHLWRMERKPGDREALEWALRALGSEREDQLYMRRTRYRGERVFGNGLPDLLEFWDYALPLVTKDGDQSAR